jgi:hypothetical protein
MTISITFTEQILRFHIPHFCGATIPIHLLAKILRSFKTETSREFESRNRINLGFNPQAFSLLNRFIHFINFTLSAPRPNPSRPVRSRGGG